MKIYWDFWIGSSLESCHMTIYADGHWTYKTWNLFSYANNWNMFVWASWDVLRCPVGARLGELFGETRKPLLLLNVHTINTHVMNIKELLVNGLLYFLHVVRTWTKRYYVVWYNCAEENTYKKLFYMVRYNYTEKKLTAFECITFISNCLPCIFTSSRAVEIAFLS